MQKFWIFWLAVASSTLLARNISEQASVSVERKEKKKPEKKQKPSSRSKSRLDLLPSEIESSSYKKYRSNYKNIWKKHLPVF